MAWSDSDQSEQTRADIARGFEDAVVETLSIKCERALEAAGTNVIVVAGGVGANTRLRARLKQMAERLGGRACFPRPALCTDNGAMIAFAGALRLQAGQHSPPKVDVTPRWDMATLPAVLRTRTQRRRRQRGRGPLVALQPLQRMRAARMDQPPDRGQVGTEVAFQDRFVVHDAVAQVADAPDVCMDGFPDHAWMSCRRMTQNRPERRYPQRGVEATGEELLPEHHRQVGDDPGCIGCAAGDLFQRGSG
ncbi:hypothetical protein G6F31_016114 [Rhizopus arrhizus]|nr:hypothetical protein G6F31_016114 [Rhizopus arrhizus]